MFDKNIHFEIIFISCFNIYATFTFKYAIILVVKTFILSILLFFSIEGSRAQSCDINGNKHYDFQDIKAILDKNKCNACHNKASNLNTWTYNTYDAIWTTHQCNQAIVVAGQPNNSLLIDKLNGGPTACGNAMPLGSQRISNNDLIAIETWVAIGAPEYCLSEFEQIKDILTMNNCNSCHITSDRWDFTTYQAVFLKPQNSLCIDQIITKYNANNSLLYQKISDTAVCGLNMPKEGIPLSEINVAKIRDWINAGAPEFAKALPVSLVEFRTDVNSEGQIILNWQTVSEINTSHFDIEFSRDGQHFDKLGRVDALGSSQLGKKYIYIHEHTHTGYNYFRLKIIDYDDHFTYSAIRVEKIENSIEIFTFMPNPVLKNNLCTVEWYSLDEREKVKLLLISINGQLRKEFVLNEGINTLDLAGFLSGVYYVSIEDYFTTRKIKKLVILDY